MNKILAVILGSSLATSPVKAGTFDDIWGVVTDPLKLRQSSETLSGSVDRTIAALDLMRGRLKGDIDKYIIEIRQILEDTNTDFEDRINQAEKAALAVEARIFTDARALLSETECAIERVANDSLNRSVYRMLKQLEDSDISVETIFGIKGNVTLSAAKALDPDDFYIEYRDFRLSSLQQISDASSAFEIISAYQNIAELAYKTHCHYIKSGGGYFLYEFATYRAKIYPWTQVLNVEVSKTEE